MFAQVIAPLIGVLFMSLGLINLSSNINPSLHAYLVFSFLINLYEIILLE
jgi:hypothetical protein